MFGSVSYLIFSDKISSGVVIVCLSDVRCCIFFLVLFFSYRWSEVNAYVVIITATSQLRPTSMEGPGMDLELKTAGGEAAMIFHPTIPSPFTILDISRAVGIILM